MNDLVQPHSVYQQSPVDESRLPPLPEIPRRRYLDEQFYQLELEHLWRKTWLLVGHASEFPKPGSYRLLDLELAPIVIVRGKDNKLRAFLNSCQHRGATVLKEKEGCSPVMSCQYHGWTYNLEGRLVGVTQEHTFPHLDPSNYSLPEVRCEQWGNFVYINLDRTAPALLDWLPDTVKHHYSPIFEAPLRVVWRKAWDFNCNWKLPTDAFREAYHIETIHKKTVAQMIDCRKATIELNAGGHNTITVPYWPQQAMQEGEWDAIPILSQLARLPGAESREFTHNVLEPNLFPNISFALQAVGFPLFQFWPVSVDRCRVEATWYGIDWGDAPKSAEWDTLTMGSDVVAAEDLGNLMSIQASLAADPAKGIPLATKEIAIYQLHAEIDRVIGPERIPAPLRVPDVLHEFYV